MEDQHVKIMTLYFDFELWLCITSIALLPGFQINTPKIVFPSQSDKEYIRIVWDSLKNLG